MMLDLKGPLRESFIPLTTYSLCFHSCLAELFLGGSDRFRGLCVVWETGGIAFFLVVIGTAEN